MVDVDASGLSLVAISSDWLHDAVGLSFLSTLALNFWVRR